MRVPSTEIQNNFGKYLKFADANEDIIITKNGKAVAKLSRYEEPEQVKEGAAEYSTRSGWVTHDEFLELVEQSEQRFELIDGVVYNLGSPSYRHQHAVSALLAALHHGLKGKDCIPIPSPFDVTFIKSEDNICVVQPDIAVICDKANIDKEGKYRGVPTLAIEVLSPSTRSKDMLKKLDLYQQCGVREYWIVDPMNEQILVHALAPGEILDSKAFNPAQEEVESFVFEGLRIPIRDLFA